MNLPSREECETWEPTQVAFLLSKNQMEECANTVLRLRISGLRFLNMSDIDVSKFCLLQRPSKMNLETLEKLAAPATAKIRQLQKLVQDIRKNDGSLLDKLRRLKSKPLPKVPARDYRGGARESDEDLSGSDYDNDTWNESPPHNGAYEPPPSHREIPTLPRSHIQRGEYVDSCRNPPVRPPKKNFRSGKGSKQLPPEPNRNEDTDGDYISPDCGTDEENYVQPESPPGDCYEVPEIEENSMTSSSSRLRPPIMSLPLPPMPTPRLGRTPSPSRVGEGMFGVAQVQQHSGEGAFDDSDEDRSRRAERRPHFPPQPLPREKSPRPPLKPRVDVNPREPEMPSLLVQKPAPKSFSLDAKRPMILLPPVNSLRQTDQDVGADQDAGVHGKIWFSSTCDRKTAGEAVAHSGKDGSFLVRRSSGNNAQQPYTLVVFYNGRVYNIPIRFDDYNEDYALGREKKGEEYFKSVAHIIENHQKNPLVLIDSQSNSKDTALLSHPVTL